MVNSGPKGLNLTEIRVCLALIVYVRRVHVKKIAWRDINQHLVSVPCWPGKLSLSTVSKPPW